MRSIKNRLARLEARRDVEQQADSHVIWLDVHGRPEDTRYLDGGGPWIFLPHKSPSPEQWQAECQARFAHREGGRAAPRPGSPPMSRAIARRLTQLEAQPAACRRVHLNVVYYGQPEPVEDDA